jgi:RimJ/RimL family protein N-acetyltransferase
MASRDERQAAHGGGIEIRGPRLLLRALRPSEIDTEWQAMVDADPMSIAGLPDETAFRARLLRSGRLENGSLDLAIDLDGATIGRIQTFVPPNRSLPPGVFTVGIGLREEVRGKGYGREALALLTDWLFEHAAADRVEAPTDPANVAMRAVFERVGWGFVGSLREFERDWVRYAITRDVWRARRGADGGRDQADRPSP